MNWVRDIQEGDVHLLVTSLGTDAGGQSMDLIFTGQDRFQGMVDTLTYVSGFDATADEQREWLSKIIKIGLMRYVGLTSDAEEIEIGLRRRPMGPGGRPGGGRAGTGAVTPEDDPWDSWMFRVRGSGRASGRTNNESRNVSASVSASRTMEEWKTSLSLSSSYSYTRFDCPDLDYYQLSVRRSQTFNGSLTKAVAGKWSAGLKVSARSATYYNLDFGGSLAPILEDSVEEILLRRRRFQTDYTYMTSISRCYSFGSIFNNIVNPRIGGGGMGGMMIIM